jgi:hypothetical protein
MEGPGPGLLQRSGCTEVVSGIDRRSPGRWNISFVLDGSLEQGTFSVRRFSNLVRHRLAWGPTAACCGNLDVREPMTFIIIMHI